MPRSLHSRAHLHSPSSIDETHKDASTGLPDHAPTQRAPPPPPGCRLGAWEPGAPARTVLLLVLGALAFLVPSSALTAPKAAISTIFHASLSVQVCSVQSSSSVPIQPLGCHPAVLPSCVSTYLRYLFLPSILRRLASIIATLSQIEEQTSIHHAAALHRSSVGNHVRV